MTVAPQMHTQCRRPYSIAKPNKSGENDKQSRQDVIDSDAVDERLLHPMSSMNRFYFDERIAVNAPPRGPS